MSAGCCCHHAAVSEERGRTITSLREELRAVGVAYQRLYWQYQDMRKLVDGISNQERPLTVTQVRVRARKEAWA